MGLSPILLLLGAVLLQHPPVPPDSAAVVKGARRAQERFESYRVRRLPTTAGRTGPCDAQIGRFCYWYDEEDVDPPAEPREIAAARDALLTTLARAAHALPGDGWIAGQRVRYLIEGERTADAIAAAAECRSAERGWCAALRGLALHAAGDFAASDSAFAASAAELPEASRCRWNDLTVLLEGELRDRYRRESCAGRAGLDDRLWWLARPFFLTPGNDLRTEHFARLTMARVRERARSVHGMVWGEDMREMLVRYGWPTAWSRDRLAEGQESGAGPGTPRVVEHEPSPSYYFFPSPRAVAAPAEAGPGDWALRATPAPTRYSPAYGRPVVGVEHQTALFRRGDSSLVVAAYDLSGDTLFAAGVSDAALVLARDEHTEPVIARATPPATRAVLTATTPWRPALVGIEVLSREKRRAARTRSGAGAPPDGAARVTLSDILILDPADVPPATLAEALPRVRASARAGVGEKIGLFWEAYGLADTAQRVTVSLTMERVRAGWSRRGLEALRLVRRPTPVRLRWESRGGDSTHVATGALTLGLAELGPGTHRIELTVRTAAGDSASASRDILVHR